MTKEIDFTPMDDGELWQLIHEFGSKAPTMAIFEESNKVPCNYHSGSIKIDKESTDLAIGPEGRYVLVGKSKTD